MQKYVIVQLLEKVKEGTEFPASEWPLHITIVPRFAIDWESTNLFEKLSMLLSGEKTIVAKAGKDDYFGPKNDIPVTLLDPNEELMSLHNDIIGLMKSVGAAFDNPEHLHEGFRAHATIQRSRLNEGDEVSIDGLTIVDIFPHGDINGRKVLRTIRLLAK